VRLSNRSTPTVTFTGREALILNKRMTGRAKDKADLEARGADE
jgi:hypothetical protein